MQRCNQMRRVAAVKKKNNEAVEKEQEQDEAGWYKKKRKEMASLHECKTHLFIIIAIIITNRLKIVTDIES